MRIASILLLLGIVLSAQSIRVNPSGVNVNSQAGTSVFLSYGSLGRLQPAEAFWCGALIPAAPNLGLRCDPATIFGALPLRYDQSRRPSSGLFTDIMSIPPSVARRAYQAALNGADPNFFYVRRFFDHAGGPDQYVTVTCRLSGGGARVPFALTNVRILFEGDRPLLHLQPGEALPPFRAEIEFNGTGRLRGRWEVVYPGDVPPTPEDLLTEASLPISERGLQRRYTQIGRFNVFVPPTGRYTLPGPDPAKLPVAGAGQYLVLLRIEVSADKESDNSLLAVGAGPGTVSHGALASFPMPVLRYFVGAGGDPIAAGDGSLALISPADNQASDPSQPVALRWQGDPRAPFSRVDLAGPDHGIVLSALLPAGMGIYRPPSWLRDHLGGNPLHWRVVSVTEDGTTVAESRWRTLRWER